MNATDLADAELPADVRVAQVDVVERAVGPLREADDVAVGSVGRAVRRLEIEHAAHVPPRVEREALDPVLGVVGEEVAPLIARGELRAVVHESAGDGSVSPEVRIGIERRGVARIAAVAELAVRPAVVLAPLSEVHLFVRGCVVVAAHVGDVELARRRVVVGAERVAQAVGPDRIPVGPRSVVERVVRGRRAVRVDAVNLAAGVRQVLRIRGVEVLAGREVDVAVVAEVHRPTVVLRIGGLGILVEDDLAAGQRSVQRAVAGEAGQAVLVRAVLGIEDVVIVVGDEVRIERRIHDSLLQTCVSGNVQIQLEEGLWVCRRVGWRQDLDRAGKLRDQHAVVGKEQDLRRQVEAGRENVILEDVGVLDIDDDTARGRLVPRRVARDCRDRMETVRYRGREPVDRVRRIGVLESHGISVHLELHAGNAVVVGRIRCDDDHAGQDRARGGSRDRDGRGALFPSRQHPAAGGKCGADEKSRTDTHDTFPFHRFGSLAVAGVLGHRSNSKTRSCDTRSAAAFADLS